MFSVLDSPRLPHKLIAVEVLKYEMGEEPNEEMDLDNRSKIEMHHELQQRTPYKPLSNRNLKMLGVFFPSIKGMNIHIATFTQDMDREEMDPGVHDQMLKDLGFEEQTDDPSVTLLFSQTYESYLVASDILDIVRNR